jgi:hypothetical protein
MKGHAENLELPAGFEALDRDQLLKVLDATGEELERGLGLGMPQNGDGTFHFVRVLAWIEKTLGDVHGAKR